MRTYATSRELENYLAKGVGKFTGLLGKRTMDFKDFVAKLEEIEKQYSNFPPENLWTKSGQQVLEQFNTFWAIAILVMTNEGLLSALTAERVEYLYENYDKVKALNIFDNIGFKEYLMQEDAFREYIMQEEDEAVQEESEPEQKYNNGNYIDLE